MLIGEVARRSGVSARMLRHYESLGLVRPTGRTVGGYREYSEEDIQRIFHVEGLRSLGLSLRQVARAMDDPAFTPSALVGDLILRTEDRLRRERELLDRLRAIDGSAPADWRGVLRVVELLRGLDSPSAARRQQAVLAPAEDVPVPAEVLARAVLAESDPHVAGALRWALARAGADGVASVAAGLRAEEVDVRRRAVLAIAEMPGDEAAAVLVDALGDSDATVRAHAAVALGGRGEAAAVPALVEMVVGGVNDVEAAEVLGALALDPGRAERIMSALVDALAAHTADSAVRIRLTQALVEMPAALARDVLRSLARDDDRAVALVASALVGVLERRSHEDGG
ncbi:DNA-binding transcriptional regulator, MerR family [Streptoalloteichus tenebrarius]|uniref:DNA-binding transcriptional regulator, MerR family n=1 Tax=Streptoalloteichus tenebrarius (strain ATCC 17920 / DSM 40477 / JCM 4838 / CBS 697.72 / NBRC 16177 / NCIMB 11028 / NRRL B-12390 / A12253. 1 / ISP 5477) TaxID=1933 RepID=A0ABT1HNH5_STRSD|nr:MerR family transcriptional regulator [Streptoalloteichus tenebrarius]MCP2257064.1 DNA-binding transcriptional regulator, MerR family [Streptoalloteichus tenebrarius]BFE98696.1 MerR family transcriptional regulator [Streptoalloteichus tenebrarius]